MSEELRSVALSRIASNHYRATTPSGASIEFGQTDDLMTPVEVLLAALAGCMAITPDTVTSRHTEPTKFAVTASANKLNEDGATRLDQVHLDFDITFPDDKEGLRAAQGLEKLVMLSHEKYCTVSRTLEHPTEVGLTVRPQNAESAPTD